VREKRKSNKKYGQSRDTGNIVHKIQDGDKHNNEKKHNTESFTKQMCNQMVYIEGQTIHWPNEKGQKDKQ
jgi:aromatic ring-opening dioxygenase catalytic subunit (LigB family)